MGTKRVWVYQYNIPALIEFKRKYYFLISLLLFEYEPCGFNNNVEISGFNKI